MMKIIAETAFNHNGDVEYLTELISSAHQAGTDYVTVQIMHTNSFCVKNYERYKTYVDTEISQHDWKKIFDACESEQMKLIPCVLEEESFRFCYDHGFRLFKIHATDITNKMFLEEISNKNCDVILETQCASNFDIKFALDILGDRVVCLMHGFSDYPTEIENLSLNALDHMSKEFGLPVGFADHSLDTVGIPLMCLSKNCAFLEKHITLSRDNRNFDWQVSLYPDQFSVMVSNIRHYRKSLGIGVKHPTDKEASYRSVLYKKYLSLGERMLRSDEGKDYVGTVFDGLKKKNVGIAVIARLKSQRLEEKVLRFFHTDSMIVDLCKRVETSGFPLFLATSHLREDEKLVSLCKERGIKTFVGHPLSVIDRMLWLAFENEWGGIFRVTGDNPYTDPELMKKMSDLLIKEDLDYVRVNGAPFGTTAELFSTSYLWDLYLRMKNPMNSEYLSWFVLNDETAKMGVIELSLFDSDLKFVNLSVDYDVDLKRCLLILEGSSKKNFIDMTFYDVINLIDINDTMDKNKTIKLPEGEGITLSDYISLIEGKSYNAREFLQYE